MKRKRENGIERKRTAYLATRVELLVPDGRDLHDVPLRGDVEVPQVHRHGDIVALGNLVHVSTHKAFI